MSRAGQLHLEGKGALVTGAGSGIGLAISQAFVEAGARVVLFGRREAPLRKAAAELGEERAVTCPGDVTSASDRARLVETAIREFGYLDVLVNNAGAVTAPGPVEELSDSQWRGLLETNLTAPMALSRAALRFLRTRRGSIINISSGASMKPVPGFGGYGASKAAMNYASQVLALEAAPEVRVNVICPGGVDTPIFESFASAADAARIKEGMAGATPLGRIGDPKDVAAAALYLASDAARWVTGALLRVDGGLNLR